MSRIYNVVWEFVMHPITITQALAWRKPAGALSWLEPHILCCDGLWLVWYRTDGHTWSEVGRLPARS